MSERQATLHDERIDLLSAMAVDLRARLAAAEAERDAALKDAAQLRALIKHYTTAPDLAERLRGWDVLCSIGMQDGKP